MEITRTFSTEGVHPYDEVAWEQRDIIQENRVTGEVIFEQRGVEFPDFWSMNAVTIATTKYFRGALGTDEREYSLRQLIDRVVKTYRKAGEDGGYFSAKDGQVFEEELTWLLLHQYFSFNSPVWFNVGTDAPQQVSACQPYDALVTTEHGLRRIGDLHRESASGTMVATANGDALILATKHNGRKEVLRITTASGHEVDVTADHLVWTRGKGFIPAGDIQIGDQVTWHRQQAHVPALVGARGLSSHQAEAALAGWLATDGFVGQYDHGTNRSLIVEPHTINDDEYAWVTQGLDLVFPDAHFHERLSDTIDPKVDFRRRRAYGEQFRSYVERWGLLSRGVSATVPEQLLTADLDVVAAWLKSVFQADGYVSHRDKTAQIGIATEAEHFIKGIQTLLSRFGIFSRVSSQEDYRTNRHTRLVLSIMNHGDRELFAQHIGFISDDKQTKLLESLGISDRSANDTKTLQVKSIVSRGVMDVYDIQTTEGEYLTSGGIRVHNCFILSVDDTMESILDWYKEEGVIFKGGSGAGVNLSKIRSSQELLSSGGTASGPVSFMRGADASAGTIKSGGATRRAAKMVVLDVDHPDIEEFIETKAKEENKIRALRDAGFSMDLDGTDIASVQYQNANNSVRVNDEFMKAVENNENYGLIARTTGDVIEEVNAKALMRKISQAAWECADPGIQYDGAIQRWHTNKTTGRITGSNPCFTGDTLVAVADGRSAVRIDELAMAGVPVKVYSKNSKGKTVIREMKDIRLTRSNAEIVEVTLDDGTSVRATPDHLFMLRDGSYAAAADLKEGTSLKRFDSEVATYGGSRNGSKRRRVTGTRGWNWQHHLVASDKFGEYRDGEGSFHLDHIDGDSLNDSPDNLQILPGDKHTEKSVAVNMVGDNNPARRMMNDEWRSNIAVAVKGSGNPRFIEVSDELLSDVYELGVIMDPKAGKRKTWVAWNDYVRKNDLVGVVPIVRSTGDGGARVQGMDWDEFVSRIQAPVNHKVVSVTPAGRADVYDGEVAETHNFAIITTAVSDARTDTMSGVFVHNCSEYLSLDNTSCNLASLNLLRFFGEGGFNVQAFERAVEIIITAMDISITFGVAPVQKITDNTRKFRQLGIGYTNLGALLMASGLGYDSDGGRQLAASITALMTGVAYRRSAEMAAVVGPYAGYKANRKDHNEVMALHRDALVDVHPVANDDTAIKAAAVEAWDEVVAAGETVGFRNAQASVAAPTGTISFMMDSDTTGIEPDFSLVKFKKLVGGGSMQIVNQTIGRALEALGYTTKQSEEIEGHILKTGTVVGAPFLSEDHYGVFDTAVGARSISAMGHVRMMAATQPFLSGAISKTVNLPEMATVDEIEEVYMEGWRLGLKALAVYRDNCKVGQPLSSAEKKKVHEPEVTTLSTATSVGPQRNRLPRTRQSRTTSFSVGEADGYITSGEYDTGELGELFLKLGKQGSTLAGMMDAFSIAISIGLQYGVPLESFVRKFTNMKFEPAGLTNDPDLRMAQSIIDYVFQRLALDYMSYDERAELGVYTAPERARQVETGSYTEEPPKQAVASAKIVISPNMDIAHDAPLCMTCGTKMRPSGSCHVCEGCGSTSGCS